MKKVKRLSPGKGPKQAHSSNTKFGFGDSYGSGVKQKMGKIRDTYMPGSNPTSKKGLKKPPKSLA